jgi:hypothetical protein
MPYFMKQTFIAYRARELCIDKTHQSSIYIQGNYVILDKVTR